MVSESEEDVIPIVIISSGTRTIVANGLCIGLYNAGICCCIQRCALRRLELGRLDNGLCIQWLLKLTHTRADL